MEICTAWGAIKAFYRIHNDEIMVSSSEWGVSPYAWECAGVQFTPIESALWGDIRSIGAVFYPQYPVCGFFVDFGNPVAKVAIECDGMAFHKDKQKDRDRDKRLSESGWVVYRFTGSECMQDTIERENEDGSLIVDVSRTYRRIQDIAERHGLIVGSTRRKK